MEREILFASLSLNVCLLIAVIGYRIKCKKILDEFHRLLNGQPDGKTYYPSHDPIINSTYNPKEFRAYALATTEDLEEINPKPQPYDPSKDIRKIGRYDRHW